MIQNNKLTFYEKKHLYASFYRNFCDSGFYFQLTMGKKLSNLYHDHDFYEIICVLSGGCKHLIDNTVWSFVAGNFVLLCPGVYHRLFEPQKDTNILALSVCPEIAELFLKAYDIKNDNGMAFLHSDEFQKINKISREIYFSNENENSKKNRLLFGTFLASLSEKDMENENSMPKSFEQLIIKVNCLKNISEGVPAFVRISNYSFSHLNRLTKRYLGMTPGEYITILRLQYAHEMILWGNESYEAICEQIGFSSYSHFTKLIKQHYGMTPAQIRNHATERMRTL